MPRFLVTCACAHAFIQPMKKIINVRPAVLLAFAIGLGAGLSYTSSYYSFPMWWLIALVPVTAAFVIAFIILRKTKWIVLTVVCAAWVYPQNFRPLERLRSQTAPSAL